MDLIAGNYSASSSDDDADLEDLVRDDNTNTTAEPIPLPDFDLDSSGKGKSKDAIDPKVTKFKKIYHDFYNHNLFPGS